MVASQPQDRSLIQRLYEPMVARRDSPGWPGELVRLLGEIDGPGGAFAISHLLPFLFEEDRRVALAASSAITSMLSRLTPGELVGLDQGLRRGPCYLDSQQEGWFRLGPGQVEHAFDSGRLPPALLGLLSMFPSGHVREWAIRHLVERADGSEIPYLLIRLNDWVAPVREAARAAFQSRIRPGYARHLIVNLPLVIRLAECGRDDHAPFVNAVLGLLKERECRSSLLDGMASPDRFVRRACFRLAVESVDVSMFEILGRALRDDDPLIRLWAARTARSRLGPGEFLGLAPEMGADGLMPVRREGPCGLVEKSPELAPSTLRVALLDPHASIREVARFYLSRFGGFDSRAFYREVIHSGTQGALSSVIAGLGETGTAEDVGLILPWLGHPAAKVRRSVIRAVARLAGDAHVDDLLRVIQDDRPSVTRAARHALRVRVHLVAGERLWDIYRGDGRPHVRRDTLILLSGLGKWTSLPYLLRACSEDDPRAANKARDLLQVWLNRFNRSFALPTPEDLRHAVVALQSATFGSGPHARRAAAIHADWADGFALKFYAAMRCCRAAWPHLVESRGAIVNIVGIGGRTGSADFTIGGAVNAALLNLTKSLADRGQQDGVRVNAINPGFVATERLQARVRACATEHGTDETAAAERIARAARVTRFGTPEEVARVVAFLASPKAG